MTRRVLVLLGGFLVPAACGTEAPETEAAAESAPVATAAAPALLALHLYNPASEEAEARFIGGFRDLNQAIADAGHPETRYQAWKVTGEQAGDFAHLFGSIWTDRATYDAVHAHEAYTSAVAALEAAGIRPAENQVYNRYIELNPPASEPAPMPEGASPLLALHLFNLPAAESEAEFISMLADLNAAIAAAGHPETRYTFWKVTGEQAGPRAYLFGSIWADRATYDAVHAHPAYTSVTATHQAAFERLVLDEVYNRYERVGPM